jgi:hypothetical protein
LGGDRAPLVQPPPDSHFAGDRELALRRFYQMLPPLAFTRQHLDISIQFYKRLFCHLGVSST